LRLRRYRRNTKLNGRYVIQEKIGEGWEGTTYRVRDRLDGRIKALKLITNLRRRKAILNQARVLVRLQHPNIIEYYNVDSLKLNGEVCYFLLVEYLDGPRLSQVIRRRARRAAPQLFEMLRVFYQICRGMAYVHDRRILHDDLHTDNIILTGNPDRPVPKLFDFWGSRGAVDRERRAFDLRCAGQMLFECLTGQEGYRSADLEGIPRAVAAIVRKTQARIHNYGSFHQILGDLEALRDWD